MDEGGKGERYMTFSIGWLHPAFDGQGIVGIRR